MSLSILTIPCLADNYAYLLHDVPSGTTAVVDAPDDGPIRAALQAQGWSLDMILITHHHDDHIVGVEALRRKYGAKVVGAKADAHRLPPLDLALSEGDEVAVGGSLATVIDVPGHTVGHIAFHFAQNKAVFTADSLMALGCGRLFEGTPSQMWTSLSKLAALPPKTMVYSGHEYTAANAAFALTVERDNKALITRASAITAARAAGKPTVPVSLAEELATNPFLRAGEPAVKAAVGMAGADDAAVFAEVRARKDRF